MAPATKDKKTPGKHYVKVFVLFYSMCTGVMPACVSADHMCAWYLWRSEGSLESPELDLQVFMSTQRVLGTKSEASRAARAPDH